MTGMQRVKGVEKCYPLLQPRLFLFGIVFGFALCSLAGYWVSKRPLFPASFTRFDYGIAPDTFFYPSVEQICRLAEEKCPPGKILVLVGGSSIMQGFGQRDDTVWTKVLQENLGGQYVVLNAAMRSGYSLDLAGVAARILQAKFPNMIFVTDSPLSGPGPISGSATYRYAFWNAYYRDLIPLNEAERRDIAKLRSADLKSKDGIELHLRERLNRYFYFSDLWSFVGYRFVFPVYSDRYPLLSAFKPRYLAVDDSQIDERPFEIRMREILDDPKLAVLDRAQFDADGAYYLNPKKELVAYVPYWKKTMAGLRNAFPDDMKNRVLLVHFGRNPYFLKRLPAVQQIKSSRGAHQFLELCYQFRIRAISVGADYDPECYYDWIHLGPLGARRLADEVAAQIRAMKTEPGQAAPARTEDDDSEVPIVLGKDFGYRGSITVKFKGRDYDVVLMTEGSITVTAHPDRVTRIAYIDEYDDICFVEFSGAGEATVSIPNSTTASPLAYNQPEFAYAKGRASVTLTGTDETTKLSIFTIGTNPEQVDPALVTDPSALKGIAFLQELKIEGKSMGELDLGNVIFHGEEGNIGIQAPQLETLQNPSIALNDINAAGTARANLEFAPGANVTILLRGGNLAQSNETPLRIAGVAAIKLAPGQTSTGTRLPASRSVQGKFTDPQGQNISVEVVPVKN